MLIAICFFFFSSRRRHTRCALVTGVQTCALPISFETLVEKGTPLWRYYYADVATAEATSERRVLFTFKPGVNRELPLIMGQLPVLPKHWWEGKDFEIGRASCRERVCQYV